MLPAPEAIDAIRSWLRLDSALSAYNAELHRTHRVNGLQLAMLRIIGERSPVRLGDLRRQLALHPATLGQSVERLNRRGLCSLGIDPGDRRARLVAITSAGRELLDAAPTAGAVRLRYARVDRSRLIRLAAALDDAVELFGLAPYADDEKGERK